jgi:hypothetical protein
MQKIDQIQHALDNAQFAIHLLEWKITRLEEGITSFDQWWHTHAHRYTELTTDEDLQMALNELRRVLPKRMRNL